MEELTKNYGVELLVIETAKQVFPENVYRKVDFVMVKGKNMPIAIYEPVALEAKISESELEELALLCISIGRIPKSKSRMGKTTFRRAKTIKSG